MTQPPPRKRFQIHLSTAIVLMFVAGGLIWANTQEKRGAIFKRLIHEHCPSGSVIKVSRDIFNNRISHAAWYAYEGYSYGWPYEVATVPLIAAMESNDRMLYIGSIGYNVNIFNFIVDAVILSSILLAIWFFCEWLIRRRAKQQNA